MPSSKRLAQEIAAHVPLDGNGIIIELGAGTGVVTDALLKLGISPARIIAIESVPQLASKLHLHYPAIKVINANAMQLENLLDRTLPISAIVSSLPLRSLPKQTTQAILAQIVKILPNNAPYIQYTYSYRKNNFDALNQHCQLKHSKRIWLNIPPARVDVFIRNPTHP